MKNVVYLLLLLVSVRAHGQDASDKLTSFNRHLYLKIGTGYALPTQSNVFTGSRYAQLYPDNGLQRTFDLKPSSYSAGFSALLGVGLTVNKHIAFELGTNIGMHNRTQQYHYSAVDTGGSVYYMNDVTRKTKTPVLLLSSIVFHTAGRAMDIYSRVGFVTPIRTGQTMETSYIANGDAGQESYTYANKFKLGATGALGISCNAGKGVQWWVEASMLSLEPYLSKRTLTASTLNGVDNLSTIPSAGRTVSYVRSGQGSSAPQVQQSSIVPYSNVGINTGLNISLGKIGVSDNFTVPARLHSLYFKVGLSYGLAMSTGDGANGSSTNHSASYPYYSDHSFKVKPSSYSAGLNSNIGVGYLFNKHIGVELGAALGVANKKSVYNHVDFGTSSTVTYNGVTTIVRSDFYQTETTWSKMPVILMPSLVLQTGSEKVNIYSRLGLALPVKAKLTEEMTYARTANASAPDVLFITNYATRLTIGYNMALGASLRLGKHIKLWTEASMLLLAPYVKESHMIRLRNVGGGQMKHYPEEDVTTNYSFSGAYVMSASVTQQNDAQTYSVPFSNAGLQIGISFFPAELHQ